MACLGGLFAKGLLSVPMNSCGYEEVWVVVMMVVEHTVSRQESVMSVNVSRSRVLR